MTVSKKSFSIYDSSNSHIGYTVLTFKLGSTAKSGPTILFPKFRNLGYGQAVRTAVNNYCSENGITKIYCTASCNDIRLIRYLIKSGMSIEAHLKRQYSQYRDEIVLGQILSHEPVSPKTYERKREAFEIVENSFSTEVVSNFLNRLFRKTFFEVDNSFGHRLVETFSQVGACNYEDKNRWLILGQRNSKIGATIILIPKRGGSVKGVILSESCHPSSLTTLIQKALSHCKSQNQSKLYFCHPFDDILILQTLISLGFENEGILRSPSSSHQIILSKFIL